MKELNPKNTYKDLSMYSVRKIPVADYRLRGFHYLYLYDIETYSLISFSSQAKALAPNTAASESFSSETSNLVLPL